MALSKEERDRRFKRGQQSARENIAAKEIFSLRLPPATIMRIYEIASSRNIHASDLVRGWIEKCTDSSDNTPEGDETPGRISNNLDVIGEIREAIRAEFAQLSITLASQQRNEGLVAKTAKRSTRALVEKGRKELEKAKMNSKKLLSADMISVLLEGKSSPKSTKKGKKRQTQEQARMLDLGLG